MTRAALNTDELQAVVGDIIAEVRSRGDEALRDYARRFDGVELSDLRVSEAEIAEAAQLVSEELKQAIATALRLTCILASITKRLPGPKIFDTRGMLWVLLAIAATACAPPTL